MDSTRALTQATTDASVLTTDAYRDDRHLGARQRLYEFQHPTFDIAAMALEQLSGLGGTWVDVGCGNGRYLDRIRSQRPDVRALGVDLSLTLLHDVPGPVVCADACRLPLADRSVDAVLAMHMLYHLPAPDTGLAEFARVLKPGGVLLASTNASIDKRELDELWSTAAGQVLGVDRGPQRIKLSDHFPLEHAEDALRAHFAHVVVQELSGVIEVSTAEPVLAHLASYRTWAEQAGVPFDAALAQAASNLHWHLEQHGSFTISTRQGLISAHT
ncbi:class I SAM-dependent methyltransferase [Nocardiopsis sp. EMB25]|uniref:class I SAM-dependent methyltransferase n=1 Tax=Nocardiopsis sp. EMB25 TaxID=2835867 RepID=UPI0022851A83|nr:class I SAM-dependent methyltransferase [Nocardiopsis sp. EMB25]MCY9785203.1 class I SAM-dependent methyltransferase [Nocardiopsis sp. EMB25]